MRIKKTLSIQEDVLKKAEARAKEMFADNFSMYITFLINQDTKGLKLQDASEKEESKKNSGLDEECGVALDNILGMEDAE